MYRYEGQVVHQRLDDEGIMEVVDCQGVRALHFGSAARQSSLLLADPDRLHSLYARTMMAGLLFNEQPRDVLMIGLGGGTMAKFMLHRFEHCKLRVVEFRSGVVSIARSHFGLPLHPRLKIKIGCGAKHVRQYSLNHSQCHDVVMIDAYGQNGMAPEVSSLAFFDACRILLADDGLLIINLWTTDKPLLQQVSWNLNRVFESRLLLLPVRNRGNVIGFAFGAKFGKPTLKTLMDRAQRLEQQLDIEFPLYLYDLKRNNPNTFNRIIKT
ncbi:MAG: spermine synthase [Methylomonas sp.]|nr:spermine synthase [Methylomonas sp.]PPD19631.1 MAG: spermine synthase [Methylomonas sp.]PPD29619.1 MAG: spermine synthase [Methylomonas sp.]PPD41170.1 MAG: spermine synthase [Methylomonas sp.]PPD54765.1 MAG: spermine synthase [Methylomonas sp.]